MTTPKRNYCGKCGRLVVSTTRGNAPAHLNLSTTKPCKGSAQPTTTNADPTPAKRTRKAPNPTLPPTKPVGQTPPGKPPAPSRATRSTPKSVRKAPTKADKARAKLAGEAKVIVERDVNGRAREYPAAVKAEALRVMRTHGLATAHDLTDVPKPTLSRWARADNFDLGDHARRRTSSATDSLRAKFAEARLTTTAMLEQHIADTGLYLSNITDANAFAATAIIAAGPSALERKIGLAGPYVVVTDTEAADAGNLALALAGLPLGVRDAEGIITRAIHDLQLLNGEATERGEIVVEFGVPRPKPADQTVNQHTDPEE